MVIEPLASCVDCPLLAVIKPPVAAPELPATIEISPAFVLSEFPETKASDPVLDFCVVPVEKATELEPMIPAPVSTTTWPVLSMASAEKILTGPEAPADCPDVVLREPPFSEPDPLPARIRALPPTSPLPAIKARAPPVESESDKMDPDLTTILPEIEPEFK